jgi:hypothetical protein
MRRAPRAMLTPLPKQRERGAGGAACAGSSALAHSPFGLACTGVIALGFATVLGSPSLT